jgi:hypothetical protein
LYDHVPVDAERFSEPVAAEVALHPLVPLDAEPLRIEPGRRHGDRSPLVRGFAEVVDALAAR